MNIMLPWTQNQSLTLEEQLDRGVQWLDFRLSYSPKDGEIYLSHSLLTEHRFVDVLQTLIRRCEEVRDACPLLYIHLRVDYRDRDHTTVIRPIVDAILRSVQHHLCTRAMCSPTIEETSRIHSHKLLIYCADGSLLSPWIISTDLAPSVSFWDAGDAIEDRLLQMQHLFQLQTNGPFLFPKDRMIVFDYSTTAPLCWTDRLQLSLIQKYKSAILHLQPTLIAGNHIQDLMSLFS